MHYFAYGSNLDTDQLRERVGTFGTIGKAVLGGYRLEFNKRSKCDGSAKANLASDSGTRVEGVVFELDEPQMKKLDVAEKGYHRVVVSLEGAAQEAVTYIANDDMIDDDLLPTRDYLDMIIKGAERFGLSEFYRKNIAAFATDPRKPPTNHHA
jgi:gamma-glutamylcyclotransferase